MRSLGQLQCDGARIVSQTRAEDVFLFSICPFQTRKWFQPEWKPTALLAGVGHGGSAIIYRTFVGVSTSPGTADKRSAGILDAADDL